MGASRDMSATCSTRSTKTGSAHCRSSITTTCGRSAARASRSRLKASWVSGGDVPMIESGSMPIAMRISTSGQYVIPSPYERHRPRRTSAASPTRSRKSATSRDLPIPAGPRSVKSGTCCRRSRPRSRARGAGARARGRRAASRGGGRASRRRSTPRGAGRPRRARTFPSARVTRRARPERRRERELASRRR